jgi:maltooligosyltrehalose trehalohydrolase
VSMATRGFLYQGQRYSWQKGRRGTPTRGLTQERFITYLQNHDQVANSAYGERIQELTTPGRVRAMTALLLLAPQIPMLFQGQEFGAESPFLYFADHKPELATLVREGRREFLKQFPSIGGLDEELPRPEDVSTFEKSKLDHERKNPQFLALHRDLIKLRRELAPRETEGAVIGIDTFVLRLSNHLLIVNLGAALHLDTVPESLLAHPDRRAWQLVWSSESAEYGGAGAVPPESEDGQWTLPAQCALVLR